MTDAADQEFFFRMEPEMEAAAPSEGLRKFRGTAYGGGVITDHFMWDRVVFDLETTTAPEKMPVLLDHDSSQIVGFTSEVRMGGRMTVKGVVADQEAGRKVASLADQGFPWQMSVRIMPKTVLTLGEKEKVKVNGRSVKGPAAVFKDSVIREVSFCALGADRETEANVFHAKEADMEIKETGQDRDLAIQALNEEKDRLKAERDSLQARQGEFAAGNAELKGQVKALEFEIRTLKESLEAARKDADEHRARFAELRLASREALLAADYGRLKLDFDREAPSVAAVLQAEEAVFAAFRQALGSVKPPVSPPEGAFDNVAREGPEEEPLFSLVRKAEMIADKDKERKNAN